MIRYEVPDIVIDELNKSNSRLNKSILNTNPLSNELKCFKYLSLFHNRLDVDIKFFRDLGPPSRDPEHFIKIMLQNEDEEDNFIQIDEEENPFIREKIDTCLLHYLNSNELKIDKNSISFNDISNISMSRVTSTNAHMCIRS
jgi:hypothetical protein